jgi:hypothetical protein
MSRNSGILSLMIIGVFAAVLALVVLFSGGQDGEGETSLNVTVIGRGSTVVLDYPDLIDIGGESGRVRWQNRVGMWGESWELRGGLLKGRGGDPLLDGGADDGLPSGG